MSGFTNPTNEGRVAKTCDTLALIGKSAKSNRADRAEVKALLEPLFAALGDLGFLAGGGETSMARPDEIPTLGSAAHPQPVPNSLRPPRWADVREMAEQAPLHDLTVALAVYMNRVDAALDERRS